MTAIEQVFENFGVPIDRATCREMLAPARRELAALMQCREACRKLRGESGNEHNPKHIDLCGCHACCADEAAREAGLP